MTHVTTDLAPELPSESAREGACDARSPRTTRARRPSAPESRATSRRDAKGALGAVGRAFVSAAVIASLVIATACGGGEGGPPENGAAAELASGAAAVSPELAELLECHDEAVGGDALRAVGNIEIEVDIEEPAFRLDGHYFATRDGKMRIDVFSEGVRVFSEGWNGESAWQQNVDDPGPVAVTEQAAAALRHGLERPGHFWTLADMPANGHRLELVEPETIDGVDYAVVKLTLADGFEQWYWLQPGVCLIERSRDFRAYHPDLDPEETWIETVYEDFRNQGGVIRAFRHRNVDMHTGETLGTIRTKVARYDVEIPPGHLDVRAE